MEFFDWESAVAPDHTDFGDLSELLASIQPLDVSISPPHQFHGSLSDTDLSALTRPEFGHYQSNTEQVHTGFDDDNLDWRGLEVNLYS